ncbi:CPBP family intramembrane glutamic endopeptidase [Brachybacterium sp. J153]|uniref:CPBP family intramembrane glutamic endopeptidase n=1 Tax=Brachybacterium sp. J153 TaxID=3116488 RepID=UPI002E775966|nr:CPBP family intramembrane glutamic endopeptidase [Brachybacterium sp. J153]MEE1618452.1 CPBP family intramembrane glutamic endopeptidase [Brachybacterium sp. J153]
MNSTASAPVSGTATSTDTGPVAVNATVTADVASAATPAVPVLRIAGVLALRPVLILALGAALLALNLSLVYSNALVVIVDVLALAAVGLALRAEGSRLRDLFGPWRWMDLLWGVLMLVIVVIGFLVSNFAANLIVYGGAPPVATGAVPSIPLWVGLVAFLIAPLTIALAEEAVYRGYAQPRLQRSLGRIGSLVVVAIVFGVQHIGFALTSGPDVAAKVLTTLFAGLILGGLWLWLKRLMPLVLAHWGLDLLFLGLPTLALALL